MKGFFFIFDFLLQWWWGGIMLVDVSQKKKKNVTNYIQKTGHQNNKWLRSSVWDAGIKCV